MMATLNSSRSIYRLPADRPTIIPIRAATATRLQIFFSLSLPDSGSRIAAMARISSSNSALTEWRRRITNLPERNNIKLARKMRPLTDSAACHAGICSDSQRKSERDREAKPSSASIKPPKIRKNPVTRRLIREISFLASRLKVLSSIA